jgi:hypothetical protein
LGSALSKTERPYRKLKGETGTVLAFKHLDFVCHLSFGLWISNVSPSYLHCISTNLHESLWYLQSLSTQQTQQTPLVPTTPIPEALRYAAEDIKAGRVTTFDSVGHLIKGLEQK